MEIVDVVNECDEIIGEASREEVHSNPALYHRTVQFTLLNPKNNKILITQRGLKKTYDAGKFCFLGEHLLKGESYLKGVLRGFKEEINLEVNKVLELGKHIFRYELQSEQVTFYIAEYHGEKLIYAKDEIEQALWLDFDELLSSSLDISSMTRYWIENANWNKVMKATLQ